MNAILKKSLSLLLVLLTLCCSLVACSADAAPDGMQNVAIENAQFNLYVPQGSWLSTSSSGISGARVSSGEDLSNVTVTVYYPDTPQSVTDYWNNRCLPEYRTYFKDFTLIEDKCGDATLGGMDAKRYVYEAKLEADVTYRFMQVITVKDLMVYTFTYTAKADLYDSHLADVDSIVAEFTFR